MSTLRTFLAGLISCTVLGSSLVAFPHAGIDGEIVKGDKSIEAGKDADITFKLLGCVSWDGRKFESATDDEFVQSGLALETSDATFKKDGDNGCSLTLHIKTVKVTPAKIYSFGVRAKRTDAKAAEEKFITVSIEVTGQAGIPRGPIPTASPEVDVMWAVMPNEVVRDNYGATVANRYYGLEVVIGNNSGNDLQIAAVGFKFGPQGPYLKIAKKVDETIADSQEGVVKNLDIRVKAAVTNCQDSPGKKKDGKDRTAPECVVDETTTILNELKDHLTATAAIAKQVRDSAAELSRQSQPNVVPSTSYQVARGTASHGQFWNLRNLLITGIQAFGPLMLGADFFYGPAKQLRWEQWTNLLTNPLPQGVAAVLPDETVLRLQRLDDQLLRDGRLISNNRQDRSRVLVPKKLLNLKNGTPADVTTALGQLVIIGNLIQFVNRVSVTSNPSGEVVPEPTVVGIDKRKFPLGAGTEITLTGTNLTGAEILAPDGIQVEMKSTTKTEVKALITPSDSVAPNLYTLQVKTPGGITPVTVNVTQPPPAFTAAAPPANFVVKRGAKEQEWTIDGNYMNNVVISDDPNDTNTNKPRPKLGSVTYTGQNKMKVIVTIPPETKEGKYQYLLTRSGDTPAPADLKVVIEVKGALAMELDDADSTFQLTGVKPNETDLSLDIKGKYLYELVYTSAGNAADTFTVAGFKFLKPSCDADGRKCTIGVQAPADPKSGKLDLTLRRPDGTEKGIKADITVAPTPAPSPTATPTPTPQE